MTTVTTAADLLPAICDPANFGDNALRLAFADLLEEEGEADRAEFVRVQVELARDWGEVNEQGIKDGLTDAGRRRHPRFAALARRERELLGAHYRDWCPDLTPEGYLCLNVYEHWGGRPGGPAGVTMLQYRFRRGLVAEVSCACADWLAHGPALVRRQPVEVVRLTNREPADSARVHDLLTADGYAPLWAREGPHRFTWFIGRRGCTGGPYIPAALGRHWPAARYVPAGQTVSYGSEAEAHAALSAAALAWARATGPTP